MRRRLREAALVVICGVVVGTHRLQLAVLSEYYSVSKQPILLFVTSSYPSISLPRLSPGHWVVGGVVSMIRVRWDSSSLQCTM